MDHVFVLLVFIEIVNLAQELSREKRKYALLSELLQHGIHGDDIAGVELGT